MATKKSKGKPKASKSGARASESEYNGWRVLAIFIEGIFDLINSRQVYPAFGLVLLSIVGIVVWRLPESDLAEITKLVVGEIFGGTGGLLALLVVTNAGWAYLTKRLHSMYTHEIERLANIRKELMHGPIGKIATHRSSDDDCEKSFMMPAAPPDDEAPKQ